ncbi:uncharacterized protein [Nicotiana sylvestris]|uniref:uncharacterized protein n=1 Tax=Nicotiana sylvestris TaxID=4096 RepID=UPI00388C5EC6
MQKPRTFTPLGEAYTTLFHKLKQIGLLNPVETKLPNPLPGNLNHSVSCEYCSGTPGHDTEKCWKLKTAIQDLIDANRIKVPEPGAPNINENPLPVHHEAHMIELVHEGGRPKTPSQTVMMIRSSTNEESTSGKAVVQSGEVYDKPFVIAGKGSSITAKRSESVRAVLQGVANKRRLVVKGVHVGPVIIKPVIQLPMTKLRRVNPETIKKPVTEEEAEEFLKKIKAQDYSIIEQLRKTQSRFRCYPSNQVTFSDDELPVEGTEHNRALYLTVKCEESVVTRALIDNGSSANICPLATLNKLKVADDRIHQNSVCVRGFHGGGINIVGDIVLELTIGPVEFTMEFQVIDVAMSYNLLLGRPWIHAAKAVPSTLHQVVKFEWDRQEIVVHGDDDTHAASDTIVPFIETDDDKGPWVYQVFDAV